MINELFSCRPGNDDHDRSRSMIAIIMMIDDRFRSFSCDHQSSNDHRNLVNLRKRYSAVGEAEVDQEKLLQSAKKRSREDVDDEVGG